MAEVTKLRQPGEPMAVGVATGIVVGITNDRQITFQTGHEGNESPDVVFNRYLGVMKIADRLKAHYEVPEIEEELFKHRETLANFIEDRDRRIAEHEVQVDEWTKSRAKAKADFVASMDARILEMQDKRQEHYNLGADEHRNRGRQGTYKPVGATKATLDRIDLGIKQVKDARDADIKRWDADYDEMIVKAAAEKDQALANISISIKRYEDAIAERETRLAKRKEVAEG